MLLVWAREEDVAVDVVVVEKEGNKLPWGEVEVVVEVAWVELREDCEVWVGVVCVGCLFPYMI